MAMAREIAGRSPDAVRGAKQLINRLSNAGAADHFAPEREIIFKLIGSANQVEAITADFENRAPKFAEPKKQKPTTTNLSQLAQLCSNTRREVS